MSAPVTRLSLRVVPGAPHRGVVGKQGTAWKVRVTAVPERGAANDAVLAVLAEALGVARRSVTLVSGRAGRDKIVEVQGIASAETEERLAAAQRKESRR